jgi:transient receptor potential cation channel subfamily C protein 3/transient receptor potential cation channel subfamily C protein 6/transient receptor potential cation channel subfamily C protein 7
MFWSIYLIGNGEAVEIFPFENYMILVSGYLIFAMFHIVNITILLNMLIAMMTRSYDLILVNKALSGF